MAIELCFIFMITKIAKKFEETSFHQVSLSKTFAVLSIGAIVGLGVSAETTYAASISGLYTTGVDENGNILSPGEIDPHYSILETGNNAVVMNSHPWLGNGPDSMCIWENANGQPTNVTRTFRKTFDLTGLDASTASITGKWIVDNFGVDILINGVSTGLTSGGPSIFDFNITGGFISGVNTLDFVIQDVGVISGFRVTEISGTADVNVVPEPLTILGAGTALGFGTLFKRKVAKKTNKSDKS